MSEPPPASEADATPSTWAQRVVASVAPGYAVAWNGASFRLRPIADFDVSVEATPDEWILHLECGAWWGDGVHDPLSRTFAVVSGRTVALCQFAMGDELEDLIGPSLEVGPLNVVLRALAGPQRRDVQVLRTLRAPRGGGVTPGVHVLLPETNVPFVPKMPELPSDLIPDPTQQTCACHGPVMARILYGVRSEAQYAAVGCSIGRDPNEWFAMMAERWRPVADDLLRFLLRFERCTRSVAPSLWALGPLFEFWAGFELVFAAIGSMAVISPRVELLNLSDEVLHERVRHASEGPATRAWSAIRRGRITLREATSANPPGALSSLGGVPPLAGLRPPMPPSCVVAVREQDMRVVPWQRDGARLRRELLAHASAAAREPLHILVGTSVPCLTMLTRRRDG